MKNYLLTISAITTVALATSCSPTTETSAKGVIVDASMNNIAISDAQSGDTIYFSTTDSEIVAANGILLGDTAQVFYKGEIAETTPAIKVIVSRSLKTIQHINI